ncbi:MAG: helix-turn-helix transcriptional regulator [Aeromicrobium sp.]
MSGRPHASYRLRDWRRLPAESVLIVDDGAVLTSEDLAGIADRSASAACVVLFIMDLQRSSDAGGATRALLSMWRDGLLQRIDLPGLQHGEASALVDELTGGEVLDDMSREAIVRMGNGSPRLICEMTEDALEAGTDFYRPRSIFSLVDGGVSARVRDLTDPLISRLDDEGRYSLVMLAALGPTPHVRAAELVGAAQLDELLSHGLARGAGSALDRVTADELHARSILADWRYSRRLAGHDRVQRVLVAELYSGGRLLPPESLILGLYWLDHLPGELQGMSLEADVVGDTFLNAAHMANVSGLPTEGLRLSGRALDWLPSIGAMLQYSRSLAMLGDTDGALHSLNLATGAEPDGNRQAEVERWRALLEKSLDAPAQGTASWLARVGGTQPDRRVVPLGEGRAHQPSVLQSGTDPYQTTLDDPAAQLSTRMYAAAALLARRGLLDSPSEVMRILDAGDRLHRNVPYSASRPLSHVLRDASALYFLASSTIRLEVGFSWIDVARRVGAFADRAARFQGQLSTIDQCVVGLTAGTIAILDGRPEHAIADLEIVESMLDATHPVEVHTQTSLMHAVALAGLGRTGEAIERRRRADRRLIASSVALGFVDDIAEFVILRANRDLAAAARHVSWMAQDRTGPAIGRIYAACTGLTVGVPASVSLRWIADVCARELSPMQDAMVALLQASATENADGVEAAALALETLGSQRGASDTYRLAGRLHVADGHPEAARRCFEQCERLNGSVEHVTTHVDRHADPADFAGGMDKLTPRELDVVRLVAQRLTNREIAERLFLSIRTVESHVLQARTKVGSARRQDLGRLFTEWERSRSARPPS